MSCDQEHAYDLIEGVSADDARAILRHVADENPAVFWAAWQARGLSLCPDPPPALHIAHRHGWSESGG